MCQLPNARKATACYSCLCGAGNYWLTDVGNPFLMAMVMDLVVSLRALPQPYHPLPMERREHEADITDDCSSVLEKACHRAAIRRAEWCMKLDVMGAFILQHTLRLAAGTRSAYESNSTPKPTSVYPSDPSDLLA
eukprot:UN5095